MANSDKRHGKKILSPAEENELRSSAWKTIIIACLIIVGLWWLGWKSPWAKTKPLEVISDAASPSTAQVGSNAPPSSQATKPESMKRSAGDAGIELKPTEPGTKVESTPENEKKSSRSKKSGLKNTENGDEPKLDESGTANL